MNITSSIKYFIKDGRSVGALLIICTVCSLVLSNSVFTQNYPLFFERDFLHFTGCIHLPASFAHIINDGLMAVFFFSAALEIKREMVAGELNTFRKAVMPAISATGGMLLPAVIYVACCHTRANYMGWGIPMATDIAFSLGVLSLLGKRAPLSMRVFLIAIAVIDDIGGIVAIAFFYTDSIHWGYLIPAVLVIVGLLAMNFFKVSRMYFYIVPGLLLWYLLYNSGVHATIAGVVLALVIPSSMTGKAEQVLRIPVNFIILPLFALANTAIVLPADFLPAVASPVHFAVFAGLVIGKPLGIFLFTFAAYKLNIASIPDHLTLKHVFGVGLIAGVGFTVSIFITMLAFADGPTQAVAKLAVINASVFSGIVGYCYLRFAGRKKYGVPT